MSGAGPPLTREGPGRRRAGRRRGEKNFTGYGWTAGSRHPDCRGDRNSDGDGYGGQNRNRTDVTEPAAMLGAVVSFLFRGEGVGLRAQSGAEQQHDEQEFPAEVPLG